MGLRAKTITNLGSLGALITRVGPSIDSSSDTGLSPDSSTDSSTPTGGPQRMVVQGAHPVFIKFGRRMGPGIDEPITDGADGGDAFAKSIFGKKNINTPVGPPPPDITLPFESRKPAGDWPEGFGRLADAQEKNMPTYSNVLADRQNATKVIPLGASAAAAHAATFIADANESSVLADAIQREAKQLADKARSALSAGDRPTAGAATVRHLDRMRDVITERTRAMKSKALAVNYTVVAQKTAQADGLIARSAALIADGRPDAAADVEQRMLVLRNEANSAQQAAQAISAIRSVPTPDVISEANLAAVGARYNLRVRRRIAEITGRASMSVLMGLARGELADSDSRLAALSEYGGGVVGKTLAACEYGDLKGFKAGLGQLGIDLTSLANEAAEGLGINHDVIDAAFDTAVEVIGNGAVATTTTTTTPANPYGQPNVPAGNTYYAQKDVKSNMPYVIGGVVLIGVVVFFAMRKA